MFVPYLLSFRDIFSDIASLQQPIPRRTIAIFRIAHKESSLVILEVLTINPNGKFSSTKIQSPLSISADMQR